jgi:hypothetical protein
MVSSKAKSVADYLKELPSDRRKVVTAVRAVIRKNLPKGYREVMGWGMISYGIPLSRYPDTYNGQPLCYAEVAAQKNHYAVYHECLWGSLRRPPPERFKAGKKLDMEILRRFRKLGHPLPAIAKDAARRSGSTSSAAKAGRRPNGASNRVPEAKASLRRKSPALLKPSSGLASG